jgi:hypothetical protein
MRFPLVTASYELPENRFTAEATECAEKDGGHE